MGRVIVPARIENLDDLFSVEKGQLSPGEVRAIDVTDALVDTAASKLSLPKRLIQHLGLRPFRAHQARTATGLVQLNTYGIAKLIIQGREWYGNVTEIDDNCPVLIGQLPLEDIDFVVDPVGHRLIANPAHGGEQMIELY